MTAFFIKNNKVNIYIKLIKISVPSFVTTFKKNTQNEDQTENE